MNNKYDLLIVGAVIFGLTFAERAANVLGKNVLVIDKRNYIGGNSYSEFDQETGIEVHKYGVHILHTSNENVWKYVNKFSSFTDYKHRSYSTHKNEVYTMPINLGTIDQYFRSNYMPSQARKLIIQQSSSFEGEPKNLAEQGVKLIGKPLFDAFCKNYIAKQWQIPAEDLPASIIKRLPVRYTYNNQHYNNTYEGLLTEGWEKLFQNIINFANGKIDIKLNYDYFDNINEFDDIPIIYTGPIDRYFNYSQGELEWRSLDFKYETINENDFQGCSVMSYADLEDPYTRIIEWKHLHPERHYTGYSEGYNKTIILKEYSKTWKQGDEPYYPINNTKNMERFLEYQKLAKLEAEINNVYFGGRLGEYAYYDMDNTFASALNKFDEMNTLNIL